MVLWASDSKNINHFLLEFTSSDDLKIEEHLVPFVKQALIIHAKNLFENHLLSKKELLESIEIINKAEVNLRTEDEDSHTALLKAIQAQSTTLANKLRAFKSRNEEIAVAEALFFLENLKILETQLKKLLKALRNKSEKLKDVPWIGFTHTRIATLGNAGNWASAYADLLSIAVDEIPRLKSLVSQVSMGSGPGFGTPLKIRFTGKLKNKANPQLMQHLRILKHTEIAMFCFKISNIFARMASDVIFYSSDNNSYVIIDPNIAQGSSAMPHKLNPDVFELIRANHTRFKCWVDFCSHSGNLISGYHRDYQLSKEASVSAMLLIQREARAMNITIDKIEINQKKIVKDAKKHKKLLTSFSMLSQESLRGNDPSELYDKMRKN